MVPFRHGMWEMWIDKHYQTVVWYIVMVVKLYCYILLYVSVVNSHWVSHVYMNECMFECEIVDEWKNEYKHQHLTIIILYFLINTN